MSKFLTVPLRSLLLLLLVPAGVSSNHSLGVREPSVAAPPQVTSLTGEYSARLNFPKCGCSVNKLRGSAALRINDRRITIEMGLILIEGNIDLDAGGGKGRIKKGRIKFDKAIVNGARMSYNKDPIPVTIRAKTGQNFKTVKLHNPGGDFTICGTSEPTVKPIPPCPQN